MRIHAIAGSAFAVLALVLSAGCATRREKAPPPPVANSRVQTFLATAQDPRRFWLTVQPSAGGPVFVGANRVHPNQAAPMRFVNGRPLWDRSVQPPVVAVRGRDKTEFPALIDTSSKESWADFEAALELSLTPLGPPPFARKPVHMANADDGYLCVASTLRFEELRIENVLLYAHVIAESLGPLSRGTYGPQARLVIGSDLLRILRCFQLDYGRLQASFFSTTPYKPADETLVATAPLADVQGILAAKGFLDGQPATFLFDSAGDFELAVANPSQPVARQVTVGDLVVRDVPVAALADQGLGLPGYPRIGRRLLARFKVTFDNKLRVVYFEKPEGA